MTIEQRLENLERLVNALSKKIDNQKFYADADMSGVRKGVADATPFTVSKMAYYGESEKVFYDVPDGNTSIFFDNYGGGYSISRVSNMLTVSFDELTADTNITVMVQ